MNKARFILALPLADAGGSSAELAACATRKAVLDGGVRIWIGDNSPIHFLDARAAIIGKVFSKDACRPASRFFLDERRPPEAAFSHLIASHWGAYVAICYDVSRGCWAVMPDPSGLLPVYRWQTPAHVLLTSDPALFDLPRLGRPKPDYSRIAAFLARPELRQRHTGLEGIVELRPGAMHLPVLREQPEVVLWHPRTFMPGGEPVAFEQAAEALRECLVGVIDAWAREHTNPVVAVSGGVDSSLICAALSLKNHNFGCVTIATADPSGDERVYARELAAHFDSVLAERVYDPALFNPFASASVGQPRPNRRLFTTAIDESLIDGAGSLDAQVILDGNGGDNLFCFLHSAAPVVDRLRSGAGWRATFGTLIDMCQVTGCDIPTMMRASIRRALRRSGAEWPVDSSLLCQRRSEFDVCEPLTPWLTEGAEIHSGKRDHLALIMKAQNHIHGIGVGPPRLSPLASQPLVELCLAVPTWQWPKGGINRALARQALAENLPPSILARTSKAGPDSFVRRIFDHHRGSLRELLLDGLLSRNDVLDRDAVERAFIVDTSSSGSTVYRLLDLVEAENWVRSWT